MQGHFFYSTSLNHQFKAIYEQTFHLHDLIIRNRGLSST